MRRRTFLQTTLSATAGSVLAACKPKPNLTPSIGASTSGPLRPSDGSLPEKFLLTGGSKGLQLFFHGLCAFVQAKTGSAPLRVAMIKGYPDHAEHQHIASLLLPRDGVDFANTDARPSAIDSDHVIYSLNDVFVTLKYDGTVATPGVKVSESEIGEGCVDPRNPTKWNDIGWVLSMSAFADFKSGTKRDWSKIPEVSQAQFEAQHGSVERDFDGKEQNSRVDLVEWNINGKHRIVKQAARLRVHHDALSLELKPRGGGSPTTIALRSKQAVVNGAIVNLPGQRKLVEQPGNRLTDALAYYQLLDPSPLGKGNDGMLGVPLWSNQPHRCTTRLSIECSCCPPGSP